MTRRKMSGGNSNYSLESQNQDFDDVDIYGL